LVWFGDRGDRLGIVRIVGIVWFWCFDGLVVVWRFAAAASLQGGPPVSARLTKVEKKKQSGE